jgi:hypothetical protein
MNTLLNGGIAGQRTSGRRGWSTLQCVVLAGCLAGLALTSGCGTVLVYPFFPRTGAHGIVVDQNSVPMPNVELRVTWQDRSLQMWPWPPECRTRIVSGPGGKWEFYTRDVSTLYIRPIPPEGYRVAPQTPATGNEAIVGPINSGECPKNTFVLRLVRIGTVQTRPAK